MNKIDSKIDRTTDGSAGQNRGYFSEKATNCDRVAEDIPENLQHVTPALISPMFAWSVQTERYSAVLQHLPPPRNEHYLESAQKWIRYPGKVSIAFPVETIKPKVQRAHNTVPGQLPRRVDVERRRRKYAKMNINELLTEAGIDNFQLIPVHVLETIDSMLEMKVNIFNRCCLFPLEWFDNRDFDPMSPEEWLKLGFVDGIRHPIPAEAFLPNRLIQENPQRKTLLQAFGSIESISSHVQQDVNKVKNNLYMWTKVAVKCYDPHTDKWIVIDLETSINYKIPRIYLMFTAEDPEDFVKRIQYAVNLREKCEQVLKFELIVDCLQLTELPELQPVMLDRLLKLAKSTIRDPKAEWVEDLVEQVKLMHEHALSSMDFMEKVLKHPEEYPFLKVPDSYCSASKPPIKSVGKKRCKQLAQMLRRNTIFYVQQSIEAMYMVASACETIDKQSLFMLSTVKKNTLKDFVSIQQYTSNTVTEYLKGFWLENMSGQICMLLRGVGKGWLDLTINDWGVYQASKIFRFLRQVQFRMQDVLQRFLNRAILGFSKFLCDPCVVFQHTDEQSFEWTHSFYYSPYKPRTSCLFLLTISMNASGARYSTDPDEFRPAIIDIFDNALLQCCGIHQIDPKVMTCLVFRKDLYLKSIVLVEDLIEEHRNKLTETYDRAVIPLKAYAKKFDELIPLYTLNVTNYVNEFFSTERYPYEVTEEILLQTRMRDQLEENLPKVIVIGPFQVSVDPLKQMLLSKRREIIKKQLETYASRITKKTVVLNDQFLQVMIKISEKAESVEQLFAIGEYAKTVPEKIVELNETLRLLLLEYDILDYFWQTLSDENFALKWKAIAWPIKIMHYLESLKDLQEINIEEFKTIQINDVIHFNDQIDSLNEQILKYSRMFDPLKAAENAADIKKTWKLVTELEKQGEILNQRQILFGLSTINLNIMQEVAQNIGRYRSLWLSCAEFLKYQELAYGNQLIDLDVAELKTSINCVRENLTNALEYFNDHPEILNVIDHCLDLIEKFEPSLTIIDCIRSPHWTSLQWQELIKRAELDMKYTLSINFQYCVNKGILNHLDLVKEVWEESKNEANVEARVSAEETLQKHEETETSVGKKKKRRGRTDL